MRLGTIKPLHGWRAFVGEVGIVVLGVLIALAAGQVVDDIHWREEVAAQRASLLREAQDNLRVIRRRQELQGCVSRRLAAIRLLLARHTRHERLGIIGRFAYPTRAGASRGSWDIALAGQALPHMALDERLRFSDAFGDFAIWQTMTEQEHAVWVRLSALNEAAALSESDWSALRSAYGEAVAVNDDRLTYAAWALRSVGDRSLHLDSGPVRGDPTYAALDRRICERYVTGA